VNGGMPRHDYSISGTCMTEKNKPI
jgi:hypothetical protein